MDIDEKPASRGPAIDPALSAPVSEPSSVAAPGHEPSPSTSVHGAGDAAPAAVTEKPLLPRAPSIGPIQPIPPFGVKAAAIAPSAPSSQPATPAVSAPGSPTLSHASNAGSLPPVPVTMSAGPSSIRPASQAPPAAAAPPPPPPAQLAHTKPAATTLATPAASVPPLSPSYRPLNVRDALTYLDEVKLQFSTQPEVYNRFLDIMKDFKSQNIDTPGVIDRVSSLFRGHPALIQGFNTFLPPGYRIECHKADDNANVSYITVTTPTGVTTKQQILAGAANLTASQRINDQLTDAVNMANGNGPLAHGTQLSLPPPDVTQQLSVVTPGAASVLGGMTQQNAAANRPPLEFNHAISYVNKIKQRFVSDPQTYKVFLEILQTYQKDQRPIQDVYRQVTQLFAGATDLLDEFKQFLPDNSEGANAKPQHYFEDAAMVRGEIRETPAMRRGAATLSQVASGARAVERAAGKKRSSKYIEPVPVLPPKVKRSRHSHLKGQSPPPGNRYEASTMSYRGAQSQAEQRQRADAAAMARIHLLGLPGAPLTTSDELAFFDKAKKFIDDRATYHEFLKLLSLFTAEIIDLPTLVNQAFVFLGDSDELFAQFKEMVGWDSTVDGLVSDEEWIVDNVNALERPKLDIHALKQFPPSYRRLPQTEIDLACSGRDALCWAVLNDEWISHRTWSSEYSGAHRKSVYEDVLAIAEQERHWYDYQIEVISRAISALEPVLMRIERMTPEQRSAFRLEPGLGGGHTVSIYERAIRKIYGADREQQAHFQFRTDHCTEIIKALYENPGAAVPIILRRLKQKDEDWRRARREWNRVWREIDVMNWYRSLDHQGAQFKLSDRRYVQPKNLTREIDELRMRGEKKVVGLEGDSAGTSNRHQFEFCISDREVFFDVLKLFLAYLDRISGSSISLPEKDRCETFLRMFITLVFNVSPDELDAGIGMSAAQPESVTENGTGILENAVSPTPVLNDDLDSEADAEEKAGRVGDLRRNLLANAVDSRSDRAATPSEIDATPYISNGIVSSLAGSIEDVGPERVWIKVQKDPWNDAEGPASSPMHVRTLSSHSDSSESSSQTISRRYNFFCGTTQYALIRLIHLACHRLLQMKKMAAELALTYRPRLSTFAVELGLATEMPIIDIAEKGGNPANEYYQHTLHLCEEYFEGSREKEGRVHGLDSATFEEQLRLMYGIKAYWLFSIDKLMSGMFKYIHISNSDSDFRSRALIDLLKKDRALPQQTLRQQIAWRMQAEDITGRTFAGKDGPSPEPLYRIEWLPERNVHTIQLLGPDDLTLDDAYDRADSWEYYRSSYTLSAPTEGIGAGVSAPLLRRNRELAASMADNSVFETSSALDVALGKTSYKMRFSAGSGEILVRKTKAIRSPAEVDAERERIRELWQQKTSGFQSKVTFLAGADQMES